MKKSIKIIKLVLIVMLSILSSMAVYNYFKYSNSKTYEITKIIKNNYNKTPIKKEDNLLIKNNNHNS